jgi:predicted small metal-binding protein
MPVVECPYCGELERGSDDAELERCLARHLQETHGRESSAEDEAADCVRKQAYEATDS